MPAMSLPLAIDAIVKASLILAVAALVLVFSAFQRHTGQVIDNWPPSNCSTRQV